MERGQIHFRFVVHSRNDMTCTEVLRTVTHLPGPGNMLETSFPESAGHVVHDVRHKKTDLKVFVIVIPKEGLEGPALNRNLLLFFLCPS